MGPICYAKNPGCQMNKNKQNRAILITQVLFFFALLALLMSQIELHKKLKNQEKPLSEVDQELVIFKTVTGRFATLHDYNITSYNCINYSKDLKLILDGLGFKTSEVDRCKAEDNGSCHRYLQLELEFEPQSGEFKDYYTYYPLSYDEKVEKLNKAGE